VYNRSEKIVIYFLDFIIIGSLIAAGAAFGYAVGTEWEPLMNYLSMLGGSK